MRRGRARASWQAAGALLVGWALHVRAEPATPLVVSPPGRAIEVRVGQRRAFSALLAQAGVEYAWTLDGAPSGKGSQFEFRPTAAFVGRHEVAVTALAGTVAARHTWVVTVEAVGPPAIARAVPEGAVVRARAGEALTFELQAEAAALTDRVVVRWTLDETVVGEGPRIVVRAPASGQQRLRAVATSEYGGAVVREWRIDASGAAAPTTTVPPSPPAIVPDPELAEIVRRAKPEAPRPREPAKPPRAVVKPAPKKAEPVRSKPPAAPAPKKIETARATPPADPAPPEPPPPPPPPPPAGVTEDDVRALMFRYEQAWRRRDAAELRRIGHVATDEQERALADYFATTRDLEVAVHVIELRVEGGRGTVRFTRRDRFRDPAGREVAKESPPIEKTVVRTPGGVHFGPRS